MARRWVAGRTGAPGVIRLIGHRGFGPYFAGNAVSATGVWFHNLAAGIFIFRLTGSEFLLGVLAGSQFVPILLLAPWTGAVADRFDRQRVIVVAQVVAAALAAVLAALAWLEAVSVAAVILLSCGIGTAQAFTSPAGLALVVSLVEDADVPSAVALNAMTYSLARAVGPALAALAVTELGIATAFAIAAASSLGLAAGVALARPLPRAPRAGPATRLRDTVEFLRRRPRLAGYLLVVMLVGFAADPVLTMAPAIAHAFDRPDTDAGLLIGVFGAGAVTAGVVLTGRAPGGQVRIASTLLAMAVAIAAFSWLPSLPPALPVVFVAGFGYLACNATVTTRLQLELDDAHRGRVMAMWGVAFLGMRPVASLIDGALAEALGVRPAAVALALPAAVAATWILWRMSARRRPRRLAAR